MNPDNDSSVMMSSKGMDGDLKITQPDSVSREVEDQSEEELPSRITEPPY